MTRRRPLCTLLLVLLLALPAGGGRAQPPDDDASEAAAGFMAGAMIFIFFHELGHGLVDLLDLPVVGPEEDVVDEFATMLLVEAGKEADNPEDAEAALSTLLNAAESWRLMWKGMKRKLQGDPDAFPWWGEHSADIKRYYNILCLLYGSDPGTFWPVVAKSGIPLERARRCEREYASKSRNWERLLAGYLRAEDGTAELPPPGSPERGRFVVVYGDTASQLGRELEAGFRREGVWEELARILSAEVILPPGEVTIRLADCGVENAFWNPDDRSITLCYEMFGFVLRLYVEEVKAQLAAEQKGAPPAPAPPAGPAPPQAGARFGPLAPALDSGQDAPWSRGFEGEAYVLRNTADPASIYRITVATPDIEGRRVITTDLAIEAGAQGGAAGLVFAGDDRVRFFLLLLPGEGVGVFRFGDGRLEPLQNWSAEAAGGPHRLTVVEQGQEIAVALDRRQLGTLRDPAFGRGPVGIVAFGTGTFRFTGFSAEALDGPPRTGPLGPVGQPPEPAPPQPPGPGQPAPPQPPGPAAGPPICRARRGRAR